MQKRWSHSLISCCLQTESAQVLPNSVWATSILSWDRFLIKCPGCSSWIWYLLVHSSVETCWILEVVLKELIIFRSRIPYMKINTPLRESIFGPSLLDSSLPAALYSWYSLLQRTVQSRIKFGSRVWSHMCFSLFNSLWCVFMQWSPSTTSRACRHLVLIVLWNECRWSGHMLWQVWWCTCKLMPLTNSVKCPLMILSWRLPNVKFGLQHAILTACLSPTDFPTPVNSKAKFDIVSSNCLALGAQLNLKILFCLK